MSKSSTITLEAKKVVSKKPACSLITFKEMVFQEMEAIEMLTVFNKMAEDLLCSDLTEDTNYRNEITVLQRNITKAILGLHKGIAPDDIHVLQFVFE